MSTTSIGSRPLNRLASESSPYLKQHQHNPVDWYPWGQEAFERARRENRPVLLSVGYSTCHWCHVMERECFEDKEIAKMMNEHFINIKVDREQRPDVDRRYMSFVQATTGGGGWPLTVFLTPDRVPFFGGTYFPPKDVSGQTGFPTLLRLIASRWHSSKDELTESGKQILTLLAKAARPSLEQGEHNLDQTVNRALSHYEQSYDRMYGGFGSLPKFPTPPGLAFLLRCAASTAILEAAHAERAGSMALGTLKAIANGGIHDHLEGGFHRYAIDRQWHLPHFEKMLYDQGQLMNVFSVAYALKQEPEFKTAVLGLFSYSTKHLQSPDGAFYGGEDADSLPRIGDSVKKEGAFALWSFAELKEVLKDDALLKVFCDHYGVLVEGNISPFHDPHSEMTGLNVLDALLGKSDEHPHDTSQLEREEALAHARRLLAQRRAERLRPELDTNILAGWNGLMISGLCRACRVFGLCDRYTLEAERAACFILDKMVVDGRLLRVLGEKIEGFADDYSYFIQALLDLYEKTLKQIYLEAAVSLQACMTKLFWDSKVGAFTQSASESEVSQTYDDYDGAEPSSNSVSAMNLVRLHLLTEDPSYKQQYEAIFQTFASRLAQIPHSMPGLLDAYLFASSTPIMVVLEGPDVDSLQELHLTALSTYHHNMLIKAEIGPGKTARAHVCKGTICSAPTSDAEALIGLLRSI